MSDGASLIQPTLILKNCLEMDKECNREQLDKFFNRHLKPWCLKSLFRGSLKGGLAVSVSSFVTANNRITK